MSAKHEPSFFVSRKLGRLPLYKVIAARLLGLPWTVIAFLFTPFITVKSALQEQAGVCAQEGPVLFFAWHENTTLTFLLNRKVKAFSTLLGITHDKLSAISMTLPVAYMGYRMFVFTLRDRNTRPQQICEAFEHSSKVILMADSGGPYHSVKPGIVKIARLAKAHLVPLRFKIDRYFLVGKGVHQHIIPLPGATIEFSLGAPIGCAGDEDEVVARCNRVMEEVWEDMKS